MTKFEEEVTRPDNGPITELNNSMHSVLSQYRKMREYADYLEYELKQKDEHILKLENENSFMRDERTTFDSNGMVVEPQLQQQALPVVREDVAEWIEILKTKGLKPLKNPETYGETGFTEEKTQNIVFWISEHQEDYMRAWLDGYTVEKPQLFYLKAKELLVVGDYDHVEDLWLDCNKNFTPKKQYAHKFTQQEIDSIQTGSYEKIEVHMEEEK
ncbi:DUF1642 domain-containing protein [Lactococcus cremoris]|uniref:DUF1642 domain-containing protein n=1 Tax=Lactococcus phage r1t TaxID=43685 RepID=UPI000009B67C|nr:DUF1642 domain-containing protein [Lactococcus cremoris]NP_695047.1 DUF1642 domain-containing protein [Lactococcus phage r1t]AAB18694.1 ORF19 [Lactococcus phage r1t]MBU8903749.1 DUF1642 domain-containing protein [Lactococcus cremoris]MCT4455447.1 DUF1642 domain-containing protein [Lactococcus cremoris]